MDSKPAATNGSPVYSVLAPSEQTVPLVFSSPHSGREYTAAFIASSRLEPQVLRRSEDSYVDELFACVARHGAPLLAASFPRAFCDPNREPFELDPGMFDGPLPEFANTRSPRVAAGLGTIAKVVSSGLNIYAGKLPVAEIDRRITGFYRPYHRRLEELIEATSRRFGWAVLVDCHSMPSVGGATDFDTGLSRVDIVLGDCFGASCASPITQVVEDGFRGLGYRVVRNTPYAGGFTTRHYGQPRNGVHALQIEINRSLYMSEGRHSKLVGFAGLADDIDRVVAALADQLRGKAFP
jgi:N-formylglutamate amidohydrolase